ncbi:MAG: SDR family NAD(P)-dependent oxidoreductase [Alphaproteobacteria bacterium]
MVDLRDKVAVVTGAASGIGRATASLFARSGMKLALADVERVALEETAHELAALGARVVAVPTDVSREEYVARLAAATLDAFGSVHVVFNNAGVALSGPAWEASAEDWRWVLGVNLGGVVHGVRAFVPILLRQGGFGHVVNTASMSGLVTLPSMGVYNASKHAVVAFSETLHHDLAARGSTIRVSVVCPGYVATRIMDSARNRPGPAGASPSDPAEPASAATDPDEAAERARRSETREALRKIGLRPEDVAGQILATLHEPRFYVFTHPERKEGVRVRSDGILAEHEPRFVPLA